MGVLLRARRLSAWFKYRAWKWVRRGSWLGAVFVAFVLGRFTEVITIFDYFDKPEIVCAYRVAGFGYGWKKTDPIVDPIVDSLAKLGVAVATEVIEENVAWYGTEGGDVIIESSEADTTWVMRRYEIRWLNRGRRAAREVEVIVRGSAEGKLGLRSVAIQNALDSMEVVEQTPTRIRLYQDRLHWADPGGIFFDAVAHTDTLRREWKLRHAVFDTITVDIMYEGHRRICDAEPIDYTELGEIVARGEARGAVWVNRIKVTYAGEGYQVAEGGLIR